MEFKFSDHAKAEMARRGISEGIVVQVLEKPEQVVPDRGGVEVFQSRHEFGGMIFLVRVVVDRNDDPATVITVYRTSKIGKYWRKS